MQISRSHRDHPTTDPASRPRPGDHVRVRGSRWRIIGIQPHDACSVVTLSPLDARESADERRVIEHAE